MNARVRITVLLASLCAAACAEERASGEADLRCGLFAEARLELVLPAELEPAVAGFEQRLALDHPDLALARGGAGSRTPRIVAGTRDFPPARALAEHLGVELGESGFAFAGESYTGLGDVLVATFEDPERPGRPVTLWFGAAEAGLARYLDRMAPAWRPGLRLFRNGRQERYGRLDLAGGFLPGGLRDLRPAWQEWSTSITRRAEPDFDLWISKLVPAPRGLDYLQRLRAASASARAWAQPEELELPAGHRPRVSVHADPHAMGQLLGGVGLCEPVPQPWQVQTLLFPGVPDDAGGGLARAVLLEGLGPAAGEWMLEAASVEAAGAWWGRELEDWVAFLTHGELVPELAELLSARASHSLSPHLRAPLRAFLWRQLREVREPARLRALWTGTEELELDPDLERSWREALAANLAPRAEAIAARRAAGPRRALDSPFLGGAELDPGRDGYASPSAAESLAELAALGARAVSVPVYVHAEARFDGFAGAATRCGPRATASDAELAVILARAREQGLVTLLAPEVLASPSGNLLGDLNTFVVPEDWQRFFDELRGPLVHYALLAELSDCELFSLGRAIHKAALSRYGDGAPPLHLEIGRAKRAAWSALIAELRAACTAALTYGADLGAAPRAIEFWPELDLVGGVLFRSLGVGAALSSAELRAARVQGLERQLGTLRSLAQGFGKPALILAIGFPSTSGAARDPAVRTGRVDPELQAELLGALGQSLGRAPGPWLGGLLLSSWNLDPGAAAERAFSPRGKPGQAALPSLFQPR